MSDARPADEVQIGTRQPASSVLALPGLHERFLEKSPSSPADGLLIDLEDAVAPNDKASRPGGRLGRSRDARLRRIESVAVRVNGWAL